MLDEILPPLRELKSKCNNEYVCAVKRSGEVGGIELETVHWNWCATYTWAQQDAVPKLCPLSWCGIWPPKAPGITTHYRGARGARGGGQLVQRDAITSSLKEASDTFHGEGGILICFQPFHPLTFIFIHSYPFASSLPILFCFRLLFSISLRFCQFHQQPSDSF